MVLLGSGMGYVFGAEDGKEGGDEDGDSELEREMVDGTGTCRGYFFFL